MAANKDRRTMRRESSTVGEGAATAKQAAPTRGRNFRDVLMQMRPEYVLNKRRLSLLGSLHNRGFYGESSREMRMAIREGKDEVSRAVWNVLERVEWALKAIEDDRLRDALFNAVHLYEQALGIKGHMVRTLSLAGSAKGGRKRAKHIRESNLDRDRKIAELHSDGFSGRLIANRVGCAPSTVSRVLKRGRVQQLCGADST